MSNQKIDFNAQLDIIDPRAAPASCCIVDLFGTELESVVAPLGIIFKGYLENPMELEDKRGMKCFLPVNLRDAGKQREGGGYDLTASNIARRTIISLDFDKITDGDWEYVKKRLQQFRFPCLWHTTWSHRTSERDLGSYRVYIPFELNPGNKAFYVNSDKGKVIYSYFKNVVFQGGVEGFDPTCFEFGRKMFLPCVPPGFVSDFAWGCWEGRAIHSLKEKFGGEGSRHDRIKRMMTAARKIELKTTEEILATVNKYVQEAGEEFVDYPESEIEALMEWIDNNIPLEKAVKDIENGEVSGPEGKKKLIRDLAWAVAELQEKDLGLWFDDFSGRRLLGDKAITDADELRLFEQLQLEYRTKLGWVSKQVHLDALCVVADKNRKDVLVERLKECKQKYLDYIARQDDYLGLDLVPEKVLGCAELQDVQREMFGKWMMGGALRGVQPGAQMDNMLILIGPQGVRKTTFFSLLALEPEWCVTSLSAFDNKNKDELMKLLGKQIVLIDEMNKHFVRKEENELKNFISTRVDNFRKSYARNSEDYKRRFVLAGCSNDVEIFRDYTGNRRYWVLEVGRIDVEAVLKWKELWWGEALCRIENGEKHYFEGQMEAQALELPSRYMQVDELATMVLDYLDTPEAVEALNKKSLRILEILRACGLDESKSNRIGKILRQQGFDRRMVGGCGLWFRK